MKGCEKQWHGLVRNTSSVVRNADFEAASIRFGNDRDGRIRVTVGKRISKEIRQKLDYST